MYPQHKIIITTHSQYVLATISNCMIAHKLYDATNKKTDRSKINKIIQKKHHLSVDKASAYYMKETGEPTDIVQKDGPIYIDEDYLHNQMDKLNEDFNEMMEIYENNHQK